MKKIMGLVLGVSLVIGAFSFAIAQDGKDTTKATGKGSGKGKGGKGGKGSGKDSTKS
jgi:hypothetical protein